PLDLTATAKGGLANGKLGGDAHVTGGLTLTKDGTIDASLGKNIHEHSTIDAGTGVAVDVNVSHPAGASSTGVSGTIKGNFDSQNTAGANAGKLSGTLNTDTKIGADVKFAGSIGSNGGFHID